MIIRSLLIYHIIHDPLSPSLGQQVNWLVGWLVSRPVRWSVIMKPPFFKCKCPLSMMLRQRKIMHQMAAPILLKSWILLKNMTKQPGHKENMVDQSDVEKISSILIFKGLQELYFTDKNVLLLGNDCSKKKHPLCLTLGSFLLRNIIVNIRMSTN